MAFPLMPFAAGFALGSLVTYGYKDKTVHDHIVHELRRLYVMVADRVTIIRDMAAYLSPPRLQVPEELKAMTAGVQEAIARTESAAAELARTVEDSAETFVARSQEPAEVVTHTAKKTARKVGEPAKTSTF